MKTSYCSLKDAFKSPDFSKEDDDIIIQNKQLHQIPYTITPQVETIKETFEEDCEYIQKHLMSCTKCSQHKPTHSIDLAFNEILNMILIALMIWIIIYKPKL